MEITTDIYLGDSKEQLKLLSDNSVDLVVTSPPYAEGRLHRTRKSGAP